jgi:hypothetical protein
MACEPWPSSTVPENQRSFLNQKLTDFGYGLGQFLGGTSEYDIILTGGVELRESGNF